MQFPKAATFVKHRICEYLPLKRIQPVNNNNVLIIFCDLKFLRKCKRRTKKRFQCVGDWSDRSCTHISLNARTINSIHRFLHPHFFQTSPPLHASHLGEKVSRAAANHNKQDGGQQTRFGGKLLFSFR